MGKTPLNREWAKPIVKRMLERGANGPQIAQELGCNRGAVYRMIASDPDLRLKRTPRYLRHLTTKHQIALGNPSEAINRQDDRFKEWLVSEAANHGLTVMEFAVSCAVDAYHEEADPQ